MKSALLGLFFLSLFWLLPTQSQAGRAALVVGNADYSVSPLKNPVNDARGMASALKRMGFDVVLLLNGTAGEMKDAIKQYKGMLGTNQGIRDALGMNDDLGLFYFAGHAMQVNDVNYLLPVDVLLSETVNLDKSCIKLNDFIDETGSAGIDANIVILDACRNNPFNSYLVDNEGHLTRSLERGVKVETHGLSDEITAAGTFLAFATAPGKVALDGASTNGIFTKHLLRHIETEGLSLSGILNKVRQGVIAETDQKQVPWSNTSLTKDVYFLKKKEESGGKRRPFLVF